ncbi:hypothetical protein [Mesorhizobium sp. ES1-1]|uniref:hypothetical protein n=1 Tax=Mesorhizobium sp. ES1-1 TaxID=2876629 RepID=UPI001CC975F4|nr:hypothetical protein [Mesorhizobium sp. ES1-1]MBZ9675699.1 hypothetical protein [Mesorhizobium sp. ES1-1]
MNTRIILSSVLLLAAAPAMAQTQPDQTLPPSQSTNCQAKTDSEGQQKPATGDNLSQTLGDCGGVLKPPATGDHDMTAPAPDQGKTPVIKPGEVPPQPPAQ